MKTQCDFCHSAPASIFCCSDEAALCHNCDTHIHAANKLAGKHERLPLTTQDSPLCDICKDKAGFFFCLEDRALLCRDCDFSIHSSNSIVSKHKRFLVPSICVGLEAMSPNPDNIPTTVPIVLDTSLQTIPPTPSPPPNNLYNRSNTPSPGVVSPPLSYSSPNRFRTSLPCESMPSMELNPIHSTSSLQSTVLPSSPSVTQTGPTHLPSWTDAPPNNLHQQNSIDHIDLSECLARLDSFLNLPELPCTNYNDGHPKMTSFWDNLNCDTTYNILNPNCTSFSQANVEVPFSIPVPSISASTTLMFEGHVQNPSYSNFDRPILVPETVHQNFKRRKTYLEV